MENFKKRWTLVCFACLFLFQCIAQEEEWLMVRDVLLEGKHTYKEENLFKNYFLTNLDGKTGLIKIKGKVAKLLPNLFDLKNKIIVGQKTYLTLGFNDSEGIYDVASEKWLFPMGVYNFMELPDSKIIVKSNHDQIYNLASNEFVYQFDFPLKVESVHSNYLKVINSKNKRGLFDFKNLKWITEIKYSSIITQYAFFDILSGDSGYELLKKNDLTFVKGVFDNVSPYLNGDQSIFIVQLDELYQMVDTSGNFLLNNWCKLVESVYHREGRDGTYIVCDNDSCYYINQRGKSISNISFTSFKNKKYSQGIHIIERNGLQSVIDIKDEMPIVKVPFQYESIIFLGEKLLLVKDSTGYGVINYSNEKIIELEHPTYEFQNQFRSNFFLLLNSEKNSTLTDSKGNIIWNSSQINLFKGMSLKFNTDEYFKVITASGKQGAINSTGELIVDFLFTDLLGVKNGFALGKNDNGFGIYNLKTKQFVKEYNCEYAMFGMFGDEVAIYIVKNKWPYVISFKEGEPILISIIDV